MPGCGSLTVEVQISGPELPAEIDKDFYTQSQRCCVAYPLGLKGIVVAQVKAILMMKLMVDVKSAIQFHIETFGAEVILDETPVLEAFIAEATIFA